MSKQIRQQTKQERRRERREELRRREEERLRAAKKRRMVVIGVGIAIVLAVAVSIYAYAASLRTGTPSKQASTTPTAAPKPLNPSVDGVTCDASEGAVYHIHAHVSLYIKGQAVQIPQAIGIAADNSCLYWMHTHDDTGIIHIEAPVRRTLTLGNFIHIWGKQFPQLQYPAELGQVDGWQAYVDGKPYSGDFHALALSDHMVITLAYQSPNIKPDTQFDWGKYQL